MSTLMELNATLARGIPFGDIGRRPMVARADGTELELLALWALDRLDQGILLLAPDGELRYANRCARELMAEAGVLDVSSGWLQATREHDRARLREGLHAAAERRHVRMLRLGAGAQMQYLTLAGIGPGSRVSPVLGLLGRHALCNPLALQWFVQCHELTAAEANVLRLLCEGLDPRDIALRLGVALSTVRTQIASIRTKTGQESIRSLLNTLGRLPLIRAMLLGWYTAAN